MKINKLFPYFCGIMLCLCCSILLNGCATTPKLSSITTLRDDDAAYLVFGALGQSNKQLAVATRIAERTFEKINSNKPDDRGRTLDAWEGYLSALEKPITIDEQSYQSAPELKPVGDLKLVADYIRANPAVLRLNGAELIPAWTESIQIARATVTELQAAFDAAMKEAENLAGQKSWVEAYAAIGKAVALSPRNTKMLVLAQQIQDELAASISSDLDRSIKQITELKKSFGSDESSLKNVAKAESALIPALEQALMIEDMIAKASIPFSKADTSDKLAAMRKAAIELSGITWAELIRLNAAEKNFWPAYEQTIKSLQTIASIPAFQSTGASNLVIKAFANQMVDSVNFLLEKSNEAYYSDRFGMAFLVSRMCREIYDYGLSLGVPEHKGALSKVQQADQTADDAASRIGTQFSRRLLVTDFVPAVTEDYENIGYQIRTRCRYLTLPANGLAWALEVPAPISLALDTIGNVTPLDLGLSGVMDKKVQVDILPPLELERGYLEVGTSLIREIPNPLYDLRDNELKMVFSQDVHIYPWIKTLHRKKARIAFRVVREVLDGPAITIYQVDETYPNDEMKFDGLAIETENLAYHPMVMGTPRIANEKSSLSLDTPPIGKAPALAQDDEIASAVINHVIKGVMTAIENEVVQFPVENMAAKAVDFQNKKQLDQSADAWGHFFVYIDKLAPVKDPDDKSWLKRRQDLDVFIQEWTQSRWSKQPAEVLKSMEDAWPLALTAYLSQGK